MTIVLVILVTALCYISVAVVVTMMVPYYLQVKKEIPAKYTFNLHLIMTTILGCPLWCGECLWRVYR